MTIIEFATKLNDIHEKSGILEVVHAFISCPSKNILREDIKDLIKRIPEESFTEFGNKIGTCRIYCNEQRNNKENADALEYLEKLDDVIYALSQLSAVYQEVNQERKEEKDCNSNASDAISQQRDVLKELTKNVRGLKKDVNKAQSDIKSAKESLDNKFFSLLINTVAILGIFVAIAFTGFGTMSIFSQLDLQMAIESREALIKHVFFLLLIAFLVYNLLLLLIYFIFKLSRPLLQFQSPKEQDISTTIGKDAFNQVVNLRAFWIVDGIILLLTVAAFVFSLVL
jgi:hypothetical protein